MRMGSVTILLHVFAVQSQAADKAGMRLARRLGLPINFTVLPKEFQCLKERSSVPV